MVIILMIRVTLAPTASSSPSPLVERRSNFGNEWVISPLWLLFRQDDFHRSHCKLGDWATSLLQICHRPDSDV
ncbi:hypothetical protein RRG08_030130 [Elysia crispata]|uniref:Secreted protein n=1 Tax=Elysia crispata TaxID=231223 RepID=A0AAE0ZRL3_9GAST|nr:hypothetical protein RRG08_030130 [Elysia crispata]